MGFAGNQVLAEAKPDFPLAGTAPIPFRAGHWNLGLPNWLLTLTIQKHNTISMIIFCHSHNFPPRYASRGTLHLLSAGNHHFLLPRILTANPPSMASYRSRPLLSLVALAMTCRFS